MIEFERKLAIGPTAVLNIDPMTLETDFYAGNYGSILAATVDSPRGLVPPDAVAFVVGSLTFRGRLDEAETTYRLFRDNMDEEARAAARFFLGIGLTRHSHHARGCALLAENLRLGARHPNPRIRFYAWQGAAFYRETACRFRDALRYASQALSAALEANFLYGKTLASDMMAHSQVGPGQIQAAGESFRRALGYAELLGDGGLRQASHASLVIHSARHGFDPAGDVQTLAETAAALTSEDNYSKSLVLLELGRQLLLRGRVAKAKACLDDACRLVYASQNRRHGITLNMRYAFIEHLAGDHLQALNLVRNAAKSIDPRVDRQTIAEVLGLELRLLGFVPCPSLDGERAAASKRLGELTRSLGHAVIQRMLNRTAFRAYNHAALIGDDPLGDLVDLSMSRSDTAVRRIIESGYLLLLMNKLNLAPGASSLLVDVLPGALLVFDRGEMHYVPAGMSHVIRTMLQSLVAGHGGKEELIRAIWRYNYNPLKHDQLIYTAMSRLRQLLGPYASWIEVTESGYGLRPGVVVQFLAQAAIQVTPEHELASAAPATPGPNDEVAAPLPGPRPAAAAAVPSATPSILNYRQLGKVSEVSARRDLAALTHIGMLRRHGKGRATRYSLSS